MSGKRQLKKQDVKGEQRGVGITESVLRMAMGAEGTSRRATVEKKGLEWNRKQQDKHVQAIDLLEGIVLETGAGLIKWKVILTHRGKLFAIIHHRPLKKAQRFLSIPQRLRSTEWPVG